jgi:hypothetical protein
LAKKRKLPSAGDQNAFGGSIVRKWRVILSAAERPTKGGAKRCQAMGVES